MEEVNHMMSAAFASYKKPEREKHQHLKEGPAFPEILKKQLKKGDTNVLINYNSYIDSLLYIHKESSAAVDWEQFTEQAEPKLPVRLSLNQDIAEKEHEAYEPTVLDKMLGQSKKKKKDLIKNAEQARRYDDLIYNAALREFRNEHQDWVKGQLIGKGIREGDPVAFQQAIEFFNPLYPLIQLGAKLHFESLNDTMIVHLHLCPEQIIPDYLVSQTASGKLLKTKMPEFKFNEICHHHVSACALRTGREIFALLPVKTVFVNIYSYVPAKAEANEKRVILSVKFTRTELLELDFMTAGAADYLAHFTHNIDFSLVTGFSHAIPLTN